MCGIAGRFNNDSSPIEFRNAGRMIQQIRHRGPDRQNLLFIDRITKHSQSVSGAESGMECFGDLFLGHVKLSIDDNLSVPQPMTDTSNRYVIVYDGRIINYLELYYRLKSRGYKFLTISDTEVILNAFKEYGTDCPRHFNGMFAFAIYDYKEDRLFCARDRLGIKPFYYYHDNDKFIFASEIKAILCHYDINREIDHKGLADYFTFLYTQKGRTFFKKIKSLLPGHSITIKNAHASFNRYFKPMLEPDISMTEAEAIDQLKYLLNETIKEQLPENEQIGAYLSGDIDSSAMASIIAQHRDTHLRTFSLHYDNNLQDDEQNHELTAGEKTYPYLNIVKVTPSDLQNSIMDIVKYLDHPESGQVSFTQYMIARAAGSEIKIFINALGGNELFLGDRRYIRNLIECSLIQGQRESVIKSYSFSTLMKYYWRNFGIEGAAGFIFKRGMANFSRRCIKSAAKLYGFDSCADGELATAFKHCAPLDEAGVEFENIETTSLLNRVSWYDTTNRLSSQLHIEDRMSSAWSIESRLPLLDNRMVEFAYKIPSHLKVKFLQPQYIFHHAVKDILPQPVEYHMGNRLSPIPASEWFHDQLADFIEQFITPEALAKRGIFNPKLAAFLNSGREYFTPAVSRFDLIWALMNIELWFRLYVDDYSQEQLISEPVYKNIGRNVK